MRLNASFAGLAGCEPRGKMSAGVRTVPVTAMVAAYQRVDKTLRTLQQISRCDPAPAEILVHVDGNAVACAEAIRTWNPAIRVIVSEANLGPGGGRNKLVRAAQHPVVASFDDDSHPIDADYFQRLLVLFADYPEAAILSAQLFHHGEAVLADRPEAAWVSDFVGAGCAYRRDQFLQTGGYVPLPTAYGMEEVDLALRLHAQGGRILHSHWLRVAHETDRSHHADPEVTAASVANLALLSYLRYPPTFWPIGAVQVMNRIFWLASHGRRLGIASGVMRIPSLLREHRQYRGRLPARAVGSYLALRRRPQAVSPNVGVGRGGT
jgi:GT2 family glycosyltransferase